MIQRFSLSISRSFRTMIFIHSWLIWLSIWKIILFKLLRLTVCSIILILQLLIRLLLDRLLILLLLWRWLFISCSKWILRLWYILLIDLIRLRLNYTERTLLRAMECLNVFILWLVLFHNHFIFCHLVSIERLVGLTWIHSLLKMRKSSFWVLFKLILGHFFYKSEITITLNQIN